MASAALNPFDPASLDIRTSASMSTGAISPQTTGITIISLLSFLCCWVPISWVICPKAEEPQA
jgi:hypothetical protein